MISTVAMNERACGEQRLDYRMSQSQNKDLGPNFV